MSLTEQQRAAAHADRSVAVTAGAGTGKTHMLAERYQYHLESGYSPLSIVALTFTEKAATELRSRIRQTIRERLPNSEFIAELEAAQISTFHALATRICREHPHAAEVPPDFAVLDDLDGKVWLVEAFADALDHIPLPLYEQVPYSLMRSILRSLLDDPLTAEKALEKSRADWFPEVEKLQHTAWQELIKSRIWLGTKTILQSYAAPGDKLNDMRECALEAIAAIEQKYDLAKSLESICTLRINIGKQAAWGSKENLDTIKDAIKDLRELAQNAQKQGLITLEPNEWDDQAEAMLPALREAFCVVRTHLNQAKQRQRVLDFNDLEIHALKALQDQSVRDYYAQRWHAFLIDEFQDTNAIQGELLELLTANQLLTIVGDVKQSIYGFRRADITVFQSWCNHIHRVDDPPKQLSLSFRTHQGLIQSINTIFEPILNGLHQNLDAFRQDAPHLAPHLRVLTVQNSDGTTLDQRRQIEAQQIAELIQQMVDDQVMVYDKSTRSLRPIQYRDIAILSRTWSPLELYGQALENQKIPILQAGGGSLLETREAKDGWALLRFLADPTDDIALLSVLRSPFFAVSDRTLFEFAQTLPEQISWWKHLQQPPTPEIEGAIQVLTKLLIERRSEPPTRLLQVADRLTGYGAVIANLPNAPRREADWRGFLDFVRQLEQGSNDVLTVVRRLKVLAQGAVEVPRPALEAGNAVQLMTIHASKGLEWAVVVVADLSRKSTVDSAPIRFDPALGLAFKLEDEDGDRQKSALYTLLEHRKRQAEQEETKRVLYVALTRARDSLILMAADSKGGSLEVLRSGLERAVPIEEITSDLDLMQAIDPNLPPPILPQRILTHPMGAGLWELPVTALSDYAQCPKRFQYRYLDGHVGLRNGNGNYGTEIGTATHWALQHRVGNLQPLATQFPHLPTAVLQEALELAQRFHGQDIYSPCHHPEGTAEYPITLDLGQITLNGVIDWLTPDCVVDFKTDRDINPHHHRLQLWAYAKATGREVAHLAYLRHDKVHTFNATDFAALQQEAEAMVEAISTGHYLPQPTATSCRDCPYLDLCEHGVHSG
ncbi:UvrD-helicase domain-containing protein (plasmid) [Kovacikia minuta CCNUW1]|uniref:UvrD-helicase domain-containing protein n=1 Tax=Kovacikia minuta TaxID=2931930 RepID=UPI001CCE231C|nr:UvrD-helicase domain-containing protein [Kovacikia minuta]UBF30457.1 UvrD-helicase domain-containing protein [Kovacikia minuta CCNUW1]